MTDLHLHRGAPVPPDEPRRDPRLGGLLRDLMGPIPMGEVNWAAGLLSATLLVHSWLTHPEALITAPDMVSAVVAGAPAEDAATFFSHSVTSAAAYTVDFLE
jgi:hypothetical protein